jgi:hypothetical protein
MKEEELKKLLERYYNGESTTEEEKSLREYFSLGNIPAGYEAEKVIFSYYTSSSVITEPSDGFEARIMAGIDNSDFKTGTGRFRKNILPYLSIAAGLLILTGSYFFFIHRTEPADTFKDPEIAYAETMKILMAVSSKLNQGTHGLKPVGKLNEATNKSFETINNSTKIIEKNLKNLDYLEKAFEISDRFSTKDK